MYALNIVQHLDLSEVSKIGVCLSYGRQSIINTRRVRWLEHYYNER